MCFFKSRKKHSLARTRGALCRRLPKKEALLPNGFTDSPTHWLTTDPMGSWCQVLKKEAINPMDTRHPLTRWVAVVLGVADANAYHYPLGLGISGSRRRGGDGAESHRVTATEAPREFFILFNPRTHWVMYSSDTLKPLVNMSAAERK